MSRRIKPLVLGLAALAVAVPAQADQPRAQQRLPCHQHEQIARQLDQRYGEQPTSLGLQSNGNLLQVWTSVRTGSWTIVTTTPQGVSCIVAAGRNWATHVPRSDDPEA